MNEERWHNFAKEKPSEDMEGRNFIVSNGHYEKIATWCGYWENEPFMGDRLCDEVVRWKFYFTPEEEKANEATCTEPKAMKCDELKSLWVYNRDINENCDEEFVNFAKENGYEELVEKKEVTEAIAELKAENSRLKCELDLWRDGNIIREETLNEIESLKASHYAEMVDAGMRERRLRRALWLARGYIMTLLQRHFQRLAYQCNNDDYKKNLLRRRNRFYDLYEKCIKKAEEYK